MDDSDVEVIMEEEELVAELIIGGLMDSDGSGNEIEMHRTRKPNKSRNFRDAYDRFQRLYFDEGAVYEATDFERRFRMPRSVFERICEGIIGRGLFVQREDATKKPGIHPKLRIIAALRIISYGMGYDQVDELCEMSACSAKLTFEDFIHHVCEVFGPEYLRHPNEQDLRRILAMNSARGFPGCLGSWDCQHWTWKNCPVAWAGQYKGKEKAPTVVLEAIADGELWIWGCFFGSPGSMNDINVLDASTLVADILEGRALPSFEYKVGNRIRKQCYYLVDGIYPKWAIFVSTIAEAVSRKERHFCAAQEGMRKDVERAFGVLVSRWHILNKPCMFWDEDIMKKTMKAAIILHNMVVESRRDGYESELWKEAIDVVESGYFLDEAGGQKQFMWHTRESIGEANGSPLSSESWAAKVCERDTRITDEVEHFSLKQDIIDHVWQHWGVRE